MNMKEKLAEKEHRGLFDFSWENKRSNKGAHGELAGIPKKSQGHKIKLFISKKKIKNLK